MENFLHSTGIASVFPSKVTSFPMKVGQSRAQRRGIKSKASDDDNDETVEKGFEPEREIFYVAEKERCLPSGGAMTWTE